MNKDGWKQIIKLLEKRIRKWTNKNAFFRKCKYMWKKIQRNGFFSKWRGKNKLSLAMGTLFCMTFILLGICLLLQDTEDDRRDVTASGNHPAMQGQENPGSAGEGTDKPEDVPDAADPRNQEFAVQPGNIPGTFETDEEKVVYLTFDDGPSRNTERILDILEHYQVKATFFITGQQAEYRPMIKKAYKQGHTIGLHTYSHNYAELYSSTEAYFQDLKAIGEVAKEQIGYIPCFIRFPGGTSNTISADYAQGIMTQLVSMVQEQGYQYYDWNASSGDGGVCTTEEIIQNSTSCNLNKIMLLCHDSGTKDTTVEGLPAVIEYFQNQGYMFKAIDRNSYVVHHGVNN